MSREIVIGSRGSDLALWQANYIKAKLEKDGHSVSIEIIKTQGDLIQHLSFDKMEGKGFFTKELENALRDRRIDMAVHSYKDLETAQPDDLIIAAISSRANPADLMLINKACHDATERWNLKKGSKVGTSSARRKMQLLMHRPDVEIDDIRGNVPTRINKLREGHFDAIVLAHAGPERLKLDLSEFARHEFDPTEFIPAPAQGVLACQCRTEDEELREVLGKIHNKSVNRLVATERKVLNLFHGGCQMPLGAYCIEKNGGIELRAVMAPDYWGKPSAVSLQDSTTEGLAEKAVDGLKKKATV
jgi:hydroxymethylbilane synthase